MADLVVTGGTIVTAGGSSRADVAVSDGRITAIGPDLPTAAAHQVDARGLLVLPVPSTFHARPPSMNDAPDPIFRDSLAEGLGRRRPS